MGNQPSRKATGKKGSTHYPRKFINDAKAFIEKKNYKEAANLAIKASLKNSGKNSLATSILAGSLAYTKSKQEKKPQIQRITSLALTDVIKKNKFDVSPSGRNIIKFSILSSFPQKEMTEKKKAQGLTEIKPQTKTTKKLRKSVDEKELEQLIKNYLYRNAEQAISSKITEKIEIQSVQNAQNATLEALESIVENQTVDIIKELKQEGISKLTDVLGQLDTVVDMCNKIQARMEKNEKKL